MNPGGGGAITGDEPWAWEELRWRGYVDRVRAGRTLKPPAWPDGAAVAVALSFDSDHETIPLRNGETHPGKLSQGEYGARVAVPRILRLLDQHRVPVSFFVPACLGAAPSAGDRNVRCCRTRDRAPRLDPRMERDA